MRAGTKTVAALQYVDGRWVRRLTAAERKAGVVDVTAAVQLAALRALLGLTRHRHVIAGIPDADAAAQLLLTAPSCLSALPLDLEQLTGLLVRLAT